MFSPAQPFQFVIPDGKPKRKKSFIKRKISEIKTNLIKTKSCTDIRNPSPQSSKWSSSLQSLCEESVLASDLSNHGSETVVRREKRGRKNGMYAFDEFGGRVLTRTQSFMIPESKYFVTNAVPVSLPTGLSRHFQSTQNLSCENHRFGNAPSRTTSLNQLSNNFGNNIYELSPNERPRIDHYQQQHACYKAHSYGSLNTLSTKNGFKDEKIRSRSLTHLDNLDPSLLKCPNTGNGNTEVLKDSYSEPDCATIPSSALIPSPEQVLTLPTHSGSVPSDGFATNGRQIFANSKSTFAATLGTSSNSRRHMMIRSQVSSSEYFSVVFDDDDQRVYPAEEFIPATKGVSLEEVLIPICQSRGVDISQCEVYLENCKPPISIQTYDTAYLSGKQIRIIAKGSQKKTQPSSRKPSASYRSKSRFFSSSIEDSHNESRFLNDDQIKKKERQRWSGFFGNNKDTKMEQLVEQLNTYSKQGIPVLNELLIADEEVFKLEHDWHNFIDSTKLTEKQQQQQTAIWELISTEADYIKMLNVVKNLFLACLKSLQAANILIEIDKNKLFSNIIEIHASNVIFWNKCIYPMLQISRETGSPLNPDQLLDGFVQFRETFNPYIKYCSDQSKCQQYCKEMHSQNELFTAYLVWCETQKECNRLRLMDILVRPMQRLTKYGLLLKVIFKNSEDEHHKECLSLMIKSVDEFVVKVNSTLKSRQDSESLKRMISRIESYDAVESKDDDLEKIVRSHSNIDLTRPMLGCSADRRRHLVIEDDFKLKDSLASKLEVHCILLTDLLLIGKLSTKKSGQSIKIIRQPFIVDRLIVTELARDPTLMGLVYLNEFDMAVAAFILQGDSKKIKTWMEQIKKAQKTYRQSKHASAPILRQQSVSDVVEQTELHLELEPDNQSLYGIPMLSRSPIANSSHASRLSSLVHSHSGSMEINDQSSVGSINNQSSRAISVELDQRTASISSDEGVQSLPVDKLYNSKATNKHRTQMKISTPNTLSVQPCANLGQSLPNLVLGSPNSGAFQNLHTLSVPRHHNQLSPSSRGISYPPPSPTRGNLRRGFAISQSKNPPLLKTRHIVSTSGVSTLNLGPSEFDVPTIAGIPAPSDDPENTLRQTKQAIMKRLGRSSDNRRYHTAGVIDDLKKHATHLNVQKRFSWNCETDDQINSKADHKTYFF